MQLALDMGIRNTLDDTLIHKLGYINAHATSTDIGDKTELKAILELLTDNIGVNDIDEWMRQKIKISSTKSSVGHLLGAAGAIEAILTLQALKTGIVPATKNLDSIDETVPQYVNLVPNHTQIMEDGMEYALSNSFGFGGTNASILFKKRDQL